MSAWTGKLELAMDPGTDGEHWTVQHPIRFRSADLGLTVEVQPGAQTDGASIPRLFWRVIGCPLRNRHAPAAVIHDMLYAAQALPREECDAVFREALLTSGVSELRAGIMWGAVRAAGGWVWRRHTAESVESAKAWVKVTWGKRA